MIQVRVRETGFFFYKRYKNAFWQNMTSKLTKYFFPFDTAQKYYHFVVFEDFSPYQRKKNSIHGLVFRHFITE
jgi:hypothetical protein